VAKVEAIEYGDRKVFSVAAFTRGLADWLRRLPTVWVEGEINELRRQDRWQTVFFTLKDLDGQACVEAALPRRRFDALRLDLANGERVHVYGRAEVWPQKGELRLQVLSIERFGLGAHLAALERLKQKLAAEGLFAAERKRPLPRFPRRVGLVTGNDAAAKRDVVASVTARFPPARLLVAETRVQGQYAATEISRALESVAAQPAVDVIVLARGGGSFEDLLPFSDERLVRAVVACPVPVVSAVGHEQDEPLCDLAADVRAPTPTAAARLVVPDLDELRAGIGRARQRLGAGAARIRERDHARLVRSRERLAAAPALLLERRRTTLDRSAARLQALSPHATLARGYAIVRGGGGVLRDAGAVAAGDVVEVTLARGGFGARVEEVRP
jgi:exodeoxyribonuclease VII large subunit